MRFEIRYSDKATSDLRRIGQYIQEKNGNTDKVLLIYLYIEKKIEILRDYPYLSRILYLEETSYEYRIFYAGKYNIILRIDENLSILYIVRVFHYKQDVKKFFIQFVRQKKQL